MVDTMGVKIRNGGEKRRLEATQRRSGERRFVLGLRIVCLPEYISKVLFRNVANLCRLGKRGELNAAKLIRPPNLINKYSTFYAYRSFWGVTSGIGGR